MSPASRSLIDNANGGCLADKLSHIPKLGRELFTASRGTVRTSCFSHQLAVHPQLQRELFLILTAPNQEGDVVAFNGEIRRNQRPHRFVTTNERVNQSLARKSFNGHLIGERSLSWTISKRLTIGLPVQIRTTFKVSDHDLCILSQKCATGGADGPCNGEGKGQCTIRY